MTIMQGRLFESSINNYNFYGEQVILISLRSLKVNGKTFNRCKFPFPVICTEQNLISVPAEYAPGVRVENLNKRPGQLLGHFRYNMAPFKCYLGTGEEFIHFKRFSNVLYK